MPHLVFRRVKTLFPDVISSLDNIDFNGLQAFMASLPSRKATMIIKTWSNAWCTSHRFHEEQRLTCIYGCHHGANNLQSLMGSRVPSYGFSFLS